MCVIMETYICVSNQNIGTYLPLRFSIFLRVCRVFLCSAANIYLPCRRVALLRQNDSIEAQHGAGIVCDFHSMCYKDVVLHESQLITGLFHNDVMTWMYFSALVDGSLEVCLNKRFNKFKAPWPYYDVILISFGLLMFNCQYLFR